MATVTCGNTNCKYKTSNGFCGKEFIFLTPFGCCRHWWFDNGQIRPVMWDYAGDQPNDAKTEPMEECEPQPAHKEKSEGEKENVNSEEKAGKADLP